MMRNVLIAAAAAVAGAHDAAPALAAAKTAVGEVSWAEAKCMLRKRRIAFLGDSNSRFHWMTFNWFLETGKLRVPRGYKYDKRGHRGPPDYDESGCNLLPHCQVVQCLGLRARLVRDLASKVRKGLEWCYAHWDAFSQARDGATSSRCVRIS